MTTETAPKPTRSALRPTDATVLVTGAGAGIGAATALALAQDGWNVAVGYAQNDAGAAEVVAEIEDGGRRALAVGGDIGAPGAAEELVAQAAELGPLLGLVNNAGVRHDGLALQLTDEEWDAVIATNLSAAFRLTRAVLKRAVRARYGRIVNVASVVGPRANGGQANYAAAKAGLIGMTKTVAVEVARRGITVNAVAPGFIDTAMTADLPRELVENVPARRPGRPEEVADAICFLASDRASYVTGSTLFVDGGMAA
ncbi:MAG: 3-oxoacyl-ACP reductase FabG [Solirubrobacterales bacterium]|nr:3-oxoacyl-ACP reductase FabG [Solirubrobacterales bacterium]